MTSINYPVRDVAKNMTLTVNVTGLRVWRVRLWIGMQMIRLATYAIGCGFKFEKDV